MYVSVDLGVAGDVDVDIETSDIYNISGEEVAELYETLDSVNKKLFFEKVKGVKQKELEEFSVINKIRYFLQDLQNDEAHSILKELEKEFLSCKQFHERLKAIHHENDEGRENVKH